MLLGTMRLSPLLVVILAAFVLEAAAAGVSDVFSSKHLYDWGWYGWYPVKAFRSFKGTVPRLDFLQWNERCMDGYYLMTPKGRLVDEPGPYVVDGRGNLVWSGAHLGAASDFQSQSYKGKQYLTFWRDLEGISMGFGRGEHYMLDENYNVFKTFRAVGEGMMSDLHELHITADDTVLLTAYAPRAADLSPIGGPSKGWIMDSIFQEMDIETGKLLFQWRASDAVPIEDTIRYYANRDDGLAPQLGFDYFHINSMDKDRNGNYIISGRHTQTIHCIHPNGTMLWTLGGRKNMFKDLSGGRAIDFAYQHHVRIDDHDVITIFDNAKAERSGPPTPHDYSRGMIIQLDQNALTATLVHEIYDPNHPKHAVSQGSAQLWDSGRSMLLDFGFYPAFTEFDTATNEVLCDVRLGPWVMFPFGSIGSYRVMKGKWTGRPLKRPDAFLDASQGVFYVSWNGATEVDQWILQGADWADVEDGPWKNVAVQDRSGRFETAFEVDDTMPEYLRATAVDRDGNVLSHSQRINREMGTPILVDVFGVVLSWLQLLIKLVVVGIALFAWDLCRPFRARLFRVLSKMWQLCRASCRRAGLGCLSRRTRGMMASSLPRWAGGQDPDKANEVRLLYNNGDDDSDV